MKCYAAGAPTPNFRPNAAWRLSAALVAGLIGIGTTATAHALTVQGNINVDTRWTVADSPVIIAGDLLLRSHATLEIAPGVVVRPAARDAQQGGYDSGTVELIVEGTLRAQGTQQAPIRFGGAGVAWWGIELRTASSSGAFAHVHIEDAQVAIGLRNDRITPIENAEFADNETAISILGGSATIVGSLFSYNERSIYVGERVNAPVRIEDSRFIHTNAIRLAVGSSNNLPVSAEIQRCVFEHGVTAISAVGHGFLVENSMFFNPGSAAISFDQRRGESIRIFNNTLVAGGVAPSYAGRGIAAKVTAPANTRIQNNTITGFAFGIEGNGGRPVQASNNVWGNDEDFGGGISAGLGSISVNPGFESVPSGTSEGREGRLGLAPSSYPSSSRDERSWTVERPGAQSMRLTIEFPASRAFVWPSDGRTRRLQVESRGSVIWATTDFRGAARSRPLTVTVEVPDETAKIDYSSYNAGWCGSGPASQGGECVFEIVSVVPTYPAPPAALRLDPSSRLIDAGNPEGAPLRDIEGTERTHDGDFDGTGTTDIGAYEWHENLEPLAQAGADRVIHPGTTLRFDGRASEDPDGTIVAYQWAFGDGTTSNAAEVHHTFSAIGRYTVRLTVTDEDGASGTDTAIVSVVDNLSPIADAGRDRIVDIGRRIEFSGAASQDPDGAILAYTWDFGDTTTATGQEASHLYQAQGTYSVTLTVTDNNGAQGSDTISVRVLSAGVHDLPPTADAGSPQRGVPGERLTFDGSASSDGEGSIADYVWDFGDGTTATGARVEHTYAAPGSYLVRLEVTDLAGQSDEAYTLARISETPVTDHPPEAQLTGPSDGTAGMLLNFDATASTDPDGDGLRFSWDFGDGTTLDSGANGRTGHRFTSAGVYLVHVTVHAGGASDRAAALVRIVSGEPAGEPNRRPIARLRGPTAIELGRRAEFSASLSTDDAGIVRYDWDFGDGTTRSATAAETHHTYVAAGPKLVELVVYDAEGEHDRTQHFIDVLPRWDAPPAAHAGGPYRVTLGQALNFDGRRSSDDHGIARYAWDFGDGSATGTNPLSAHIYTAPGLYRVTLVVTDAQGQAHRDVTFAEVLQSDTEVPANLPPVAHIRAPHEGIVGETLSFDGSGSAADGQASLTYRWSFGDGSPDAEGVNVEHRFSEAGSYSVWLEITDDAGASDIARAIVRIGGTEVRANGSPRAILAGPYTGHTGAELAFDASASSDPDGELTRYVWSFGDGTSRVGGATAVHRYHRAGTYLLRLLVTDNAGANAETTALVAVTDPARTAPTADPGGPYSEVLGQVITFDGSASLPAADLTYHWDLGDGTTAHSKIVEHSYRGTGSYVATLTVTDVHGMSATAYVAAIVRARENQPPITIIQAPTLVTLGDPITVDGGKSRDPDGTIAQYVWHFGDGTTVEGASASHTYDRPGTYLVQLITTDDRGLESAAFRAVTVEREIRVLADEGCAHTAPTDGTRSWALFALAALVFTRRRRNPA